VERWLIDSRLEKEAIMATKIVWQAARKFYASFDGPSPELEPVTTIKVRFVNHPPAGGTQCHFRFWC